MTPVRLTGRAALSLTRGIGAVALDNLMEDAATAEAETEPVAAEATDEAFTRACARWSSRSSTRALVRGSRPKKLSRMNPPDSAR